MALYSSDETIRIKSVTADYTALPVDDFIKCDTSSNDITITLYTTADPTQLDIKKTANANQLVIDGNGATIDGSATLEITFKNTCVTLYFDGTNFYIK